ncbi:MAG: hypothetical protein COU46_00515 [Candidatus Niyogibacteria bacterium CG10_big_fil_rev_8_21_14_0_10_42_19]|uniref:Proline dehydrogenase domain-containing protein n=1 Tax=Candidatus Niyogibacteria bacterium CG10_big_fil_rev_8_21_14_0_10_42_19 TaxID=1974725 RepID=A0A2H0TI58_9BACT|nr:MAG: hypothetical protein COU46_00515 [Candidatus Niyogibacteria bacterium CG10_big_fil_rev_8_21_14_0_10_42_19]
MRQLDPISWFLKDEEVASRLMQLTVLLAQLKRRPDICKAFYEILGPVKNRLPLPFIFLFFVRKILFGKMSETFLAWYLKEGLEFFSKKFIVGNGIDQIRKNVQKHVGRGYLFSIDILGEASLSEEEADQYADNYCELMSELSREIKAPDFSASVKLSACYSQIDPFAPEHSVEVIYSRLRKILRVADRYDWHIYLDAEDRDLRDIHLAVFEKAYSEYGSRARFVLQSYFYDSDITLKLCDLRSRVKDQLWVRQVLGAYWDYEQYLAQLRNWKNSIITVKSFADNAFFWIYKHGCLNGLKMVPATQNASRILQCLRFYKPPEFQMLYGMGAPLQKELLHSGEKVRLYMPVSYPEGNIVQFLGYLLRRILENTSQMNFICQNSGAKMKKAAKVLRAGLSEKRSEGGF